MHSIAIALTWEFWRRSRWRILSVIILMASITTVLYCRTRSLADKTQAIIHYKTLFYEFVCFAFIMLSSAVSS